jgi:hypothetical protein
VLTLHRDGPRALLAAVGLTLALLAPLAPARLVAQPPDSIRARPPVTADSTRRAAPAQAGIVRPKPPVSPRAAFLSSLVVPGYGQTRLGRPTAASIFVAVELFGIALARKSAADLRTAEKYEDDSITVRIPIDPATGLPQPERAPGAFSADRVRARRQHYEDWIAVLAFNHLFAGADAFVAANLWDLPTQISVHSTDRGTTLALSLTW